MASFGCVIIVSFLTFTGLCPAADSLRSGDDDADVDVGKCEPRREDEVHEDKGHCEFQSTADNKEKMQNMLAVLQRYSANNLAVQELTKEVLKLRDVSHESAFLRNKLREIVIKNYDEKREWNGDGRWVRALWQDYVNDATYRVYSDWDLFTMPPDHDSNAAWKMNPWDNWEAFIYTYFYQCCSLPKYKNDESVGIL